MDGGRGDKKKLICSKNSKLINSAQARNYQKKNFFLSLIETNEVVGRLEKGESPESIEKSMPDLGGDQ